MNQHYVEQAGTGSVERTGTGFIEQTGTGNIEQSGTGAIERSGTGAIERTGTGRLSRTLVALAALATSFGALATEMYFTDLGGLSIAKAKGTVNVSWHYTHGEAHKVIVGQGQLSKNFGQVELHEVNFNAVDKVVNDGTSSDKVINDGTGNNKVVNDGTSNSVPGRGAVVIADQGSLNSDVATNRDYFNVINDGTGNEKSVTYWGKMELIFTEYGVEAVAVRALSKGEWETIVFDLQDDTNYSESIVFVDSQ